MNSMSTWHWLIVIYAVVLPLGFAGICGSYARNKGRRFLQWAVATFLVTPIITWPALFFLPDLTREEDRQSPKNPPNWRLVLYASILVFGAIVLLPTANYRPSPAQTTTEQPASNNTPTAAITAAQLYDDYQANEVAADEKYQGKLLSITGRIGSINKDFTNDPYLVLIAKSDFETVQAKFAQGRTAALLALNKGDEVTIAPCRVTAMIIRTPMLDCGTATIAIADAARAAPQSSDTAEMNTASTNSGYPSPTQGDQSQGALQTQMYETSFDCTKAKSIPEYLVCHDPDLAASDRELAETYVRAKAAATDQDAFKARTTRQWNYRERTCKDRDCVAAWYAYQKDALSKIAETGQVNAQ